MSISRLRRTSLYIPGNNPGMLVNASVFGADSLILDLEDAVSPGEKDTARILVRNALESVSYGDTEITVRINPLSGPFGKKDLEAIIPFAPDAIRLPKCESEEDIKVVDSFLGELELRNGLETGKVKIIPLIESVKGMVNLREVVLASPRIVALNYGAEDYTLDIGAERTKEGQELNDIQSKIVIAARIAGIQALDSVFTDVHDDEGLFLEASAMRSRGFDGKSVIHPRQIPIVHKAFTPSDKEIHFAEDIVDALEKAKTRHSGVVAVNGRMVDAPVAMRARKILSLADAAGVRKERR